MSRNFWEKLEKPLFVLAPMADVTDAAFRRMLVKYGAPDVFWTEFVSADGLYHTREIQKMPDSENPLMKDLLYSEEERPIVAQLFSANPDMMRYGARLARELGFDGVDINMGCPDKSVMKQGAGAACMQDYARAQALVHAAKESGLPVSVKTRLGFNTDELEELLPALLKAEPAAVTIHARTKKELSLVPARWERVKRAVEIRDQEGSSAYILGNGDVENMEDAQEKIEMTGADGAMLGRAIFGNPWCFSKSPREISLRERLEVMIEHTKLFKELLPHKNFSIMKKNYKAYANGFDGARELRSRLMEAETPVEVEEYAHAFMREHGI